EILSVSDCIRFPGFCSGLLQDELFGPDSTGKGNRETAHQQDSRNILPVERHTARMANWENQPIQVEVVHQEQPPSDECEPFWAGGDSPEQQEKERNQKLAAQQHETEDAPASLKPGDVPPHFVR